MKNLFNTVHVALYARVSSDQQAEAGTIASQVAELRQRIAQDGGTVADDDCFLDDGWSGTTLVRPALERLRDQIAFGVIDRLYIHSPDRLARKYAYQVILVEEFQQHGVEVIFLNHDLGRSPEADLLLQMQGMIAEYERAKILERSRRGRLHAARQGCVSVLGAAPYGYRYIAKQAAAGAARYEVVEEEARVIRQIFTWVGHERLSLGEVSHRLAAQGIPSPTGQTWWNRTTLCRHLHNPAYQGVAAYGKQRVIAARARLRPVRGGSTLVRPLSLTRVPEAEWIPIAVPALVSAELFAAAAEQLAENRRRYRGMPPRDQYLLQGLTVCGPCGYAYCGMTSRGRSAGGQAAARRYYRCTSTNAGLGDQPRTCGTKLVRAETLESAVWDDVCRLLRDPQQVEQEYRRRLERVRDGAAGESPQGMESVLQKVQRGIERLIDAYSEGLLDKMEFEPRIRRAKERLAALEAQARVQAEAAVQERELRLVIGKLEEFAERVATGLAQADWATRREIIRALVKRIEIHAAEVRVVYRISPAPFVNSPTEGELQGCHRRALVRQCKWLPSRNRQSIVNETSIQINESQPMSRNHKRSSTRRPVDILS